jgi:hypothetical protein
MPPTIAANRLVEREGINAVRSLFERCGCIFQEVAQQNDFGKDAYVDVANNGKFGNLCVALQIKSGKSYRTKSGTYFIPLDLHAQTWRDSTVPVFGTVYDPDDRSIRWVDMTGHLRANPRQTTGVIPIARECVLTDASVTTDFARAINAYALAGSSLIALNLLSTVHEIQLNAVFDCWGLGRHDARYLQLLRRVIIDLDSGGTRRAIWLLSHLTPHPDIFWTPENWIPESIKSKVRPSFRWSAQEIAHMFRSVGNEELGRGTLGQALHMLLAEDPNFTSSTRGAVDELMRQSELDCAVRALITAVTSAQNPRDELEQVLRSHPQLLESEWMCDIRATLREFGYFSLY